MRLVTPGNSGVNGLGSEVVYKIAAETARTLLPRPRIDHPLVSQSKSSGGQLDCSILASALTSKSRQRFGVAIE